MSWELTGMPLAALEEEAAACEEEGLDGVWYPDYAGPVASGDVYPEVGVTLAMLARATRRLSVGSLVTDVLRRHPMAVAHLFATLSHLAPGRLLLGLGAGGGTSQLPFGIGVQASAAKLREGIEVVRRLWSASQEQPAEFEGRHFQLRGAVLPISPAAPVPIYVAAIGPRARRVAGELGDGWVGETHTPETFAAARVRVEEAREASQAPLDRCCVLLFHPFPVDRGDRPRVLAAGREMLAFNVDIVRELVPGAVPEGVHSLDVGSRPELWHRLRESIPDEVVEATLLAGPPERCVQRLHDYAAAGCTHAVLVPYWELSRGKRREALAAAGAIRAALATP